MFKTASKVSVHQPLWYLLTLYLLLCQTFLAKPLENTKEDRDDPEPADEGMQMEYSSD
jgi:hypothetical protein